MGGPEARITALWFPGVSLAGQLRGSRGQR